MADLVLTLDELNDIDDGIAESGGWRHFVRGTGHGNTLANDDVSLTVHVPDDEVWLLDWMEIISKTDTHADLSVEVSRANYAQVTLETGVWAGKGRSAALSMLRTPAAARGDFLILFGERSPLYQGIEVAGHADAVLTYPVKCYHGGDQIEVRLETATAGAAPGTYYFYWSVLRFYGSGLPSLASPGESGEDVGDVHGDYRSFRDRLKDWRREGGW